MARGMAGKLRLKQAQGRPKTPSPEEAAVEGGFINDQTGEATERERKKRQPKRTPRRPGREDY